jgi:DDE superfamily endonuclease/Helix-turn-helix of DDE superfamily endonuclease
LLSYDRLSRKPVLFKSFTRLSVQEFDDIYNKEITKRYHDYEIKRLSTKRKDRKRDVGAGRHFKLDVKDRCIMLLVYYRLYITYTLAGFLFNLDQSSICRDIQKIESLVRQCLPIPQKIYNMTKRLKTLDEVEKYFPGFLSFIDSTEQQIPRPVDKCKRKLFYSIGKKKRHTVKTQFMVNNHGMIIHKTGHQKGRKHDYDVYKKNHPVISKEVVNVFDLGYLGVEKDFPEQISSIPQRKKRNMDLSAEEMEYNKSHSKKRIVMEHAICRLKKYRILADVFRNRLNKHNKVSDIVSGLVNYRIIMGIHH